MIRTAALFFALALPAHAGGYAEPRVDPEPIGPPECRILWGLLPCHEPIGVVPNTDDGPDSPPPVTPREPVDETPEPEEPEEPEQPEPEQEECEWNERS